jgi:BirA family biotin operon repressor/biotin-[acetyl-CoA-carboxylase] ligase
LHQAVTFLRNLFMTAPQSILQILSDCRFHSGTEIGAEMGCSRAAIWKIIQALQNTGVEIYSVRGRGYRLARELELLSAADILAAMHPMQRPHVNHLEVQYEIRSTNAYLLDRSRQGGYSGQVCIAESQSEGRGRRGRQWVSPFGGNIYMSLLWRFPTGAMQLGGLSLAIAVALARALRETGLTEIGVKWPNDILVGERKLAGILLEVAGEAAGCCDVVIGVGINVRMPVTAGQQIDQAWTDVETVLGKPVGRNRLAGALLSNLISVVREFEVDGLSPFLDEWQRMDCFAGREVQLQLPNETVQGVARGVDASGALILAKGGELRRYHSGEVSLRPARAS